MSAIASHEKDPRPREVIGHSKMKGQSPAIPSLRDLVSEDRSAESRFHLAKQPGGSVKGVQAGKQFHTQATEKDANRAATRFESQLKKPDRHVLKTHTPTARQSRRGRTGEKQRTQRPEKVG